MPAFDTPATRPLTRPRMSALPAALGKRISPVRLLALAPLALALASPVLGTLPAWAEKPTHAWVPGETCFRPKDFCIVKRDGWFHVFHIRHDRTLTVPLHLN